MFAVLCLYVLLLLLLPFFGVINDDDDDDYESWHNDICSFRAMTVALTVSFKLISFFNIYSLYAQTVMFSIGSEVK